MKKYTRHILCILAASLFCLDAVADEGMWMINGINQALEKKMKERGLKLDANEIYNADAEGACLADAIVSLDFGCTGSFISGQGLVITNHHCAYCDVHALSTMEQNYLEKGFWAREMKDERNIPNKNAFLLKKVIDVTDEAETIMADYRKGHQHGQGKGFGRGMGQGQGECSLRKLSSILEKRWSEKTGMDAWLYSMWKGSKYYIALYQVYTDVRLVAAPPVSASAFGGDIDNWEWPQHKCDFAMYRIYTAPDGSPASYAEENIPLESPAKLEISAEGYKEGDFTMILGYPGRTNRYSSSYETGSDINVTLPVCNRLREEQMKIINSWMNRDERIRLQYADYYFSLSNVQELQAGEVQCCERFAVQDIKAEEEKGLQQWIEADAGRKSCWGGLLSSIRQKYEATADIERNITYYRETLVRGVRFNRVLFKIKAFRNEMLKKNGIVPKKKFELVDGPDPKETEACSTVRFKAADFDALAGMIRQEYAKFDLRVEKELFSYALKEYYDHISPEYRGRWQQEIHEKFTDGTDKFQAGQAAEWIWNNSYISDQRKMTDWLEAEHTIDEWFSDPVFRFFDEVDITDFTSRLQEAEGCPRLMKLSKEYTHALYRMRTEQGIPIYPDANSSMRITYGTVGGIEPYDAVMKHWYTTTDGILEKYNPGQYEYRLEGKQQELYQKRDWGRWDCGNGKMQVNFMTDNDITGGNSGSPVLNAEGKLIGLAFDGNKESLAGDVYYKEGYNKCICVDIRFILWTLDKYAHLERILNEIGY